MKVQVYLAESTKFFTPAGSSLGPIDTPIIATSPLSLCVLYSFCSSGISALHGGHHVAQKLRNTGLPCIEARLISWLLCTLNRLNCGASSPTLGPSSSLLVFNFVVVGVLML